MSAVSRLSDEFQKYPLRKALVLVCAYGFSFALAYVFIQSFSKKSIIRQAQSATRAAYMEEQRLNNLRLFGSSGDI